MKGGKHSAEQARFRDGKIHVQDRLAQGSREDGKVECLGMLFNSDEDRRAYFVEELRKKLQDPEFRKAPGFPNGTDEAILRLSDPPYYTACPNPFLPTLVAQWHAERGGDGANGYHREPFAVDVSEGKTDQLYRAHGYLTKVPHLAIVPSILHYTRPGDVIVDGFSGSGMTGVAAQWCGTAPEEYRHEIEKRWAAEGLEPPAWGARRVVLNDLSPLACFIAANYNLPFKLEGFAEAAQRLLDETERELGWMYETRHSDGSKGNINFTVWSAVFSCPECAGEVPFLETALDTETDRVLSEFPCPSCGAKLSRKKLEKLYDTRVDSATGTSIQVPKRVPVLIDYKVGDKTHQKVPDEHDLDLLRRIEGLPLPREVPTAQLPYMHMTHERARMDQFGVTHVHHFFLARQAQTLGVLWRRASRESDPRTRNMLLWLVEQAVWGMSILNRYSPSHFSQVNRALDGVYYIPAQISEVSPVYNLQGKIERLVKHAFKHDYFVPYTAAISTSDCANLTLPDGCVDYIFTDPPFGENKYYADLNFLVESWHGVLTDAGPEAIIDRAKRKELPEYQELMRRCFAEYCRVLKPGRWMTVVFSNSRNSVWNAIQDAMLAAGFVVADVRTLDKKQGSYRQVTSSAVKQDLVISAYKPSGEMERRFKAVAGTEEGVWQFVRNHLSQVPVFAKQDGLVEIVAERQSHVLFDRMVAFHVQRGVTVPLSKGDFLGGLAQRFPERDGMYFLAEQVAEYDRRRRDVKELVQLQVVVTNEASAIQWLRQELGRKPQTFQELHPAFMKEIAAWQKHEKPVELMDMLKGNFVQYDGEGEVPAPIHAYLSSNFHALRGLPKDDPQLRHKGKDRWYVPDPKKASDLEKIRERELLKEFAAITSTKGRIKQLRTEAARVGFKTLWEQGDYKAIVEVAGKLPTDVVEEDAHLLMYLDLARSRLD